MSLCGQFAHNAVITDGGFDVGLNGHWFNPETQGQGLFVEQFYGTNDAFMGWFTFDTEQPVISLNKQVGADGQRWLVGSGQVNADNSNILEFDLLYSQGGLFDDPEQTEVVGTDGYGTLRIEFIDCANAQVSYDITHENISGSYDVVKLLTDEQACSVAK